MAKFTLSARAKALIEDFDAAAQHWGWQSDQGSVRSQVENAEAAHKETKEDLVRYIASLQRKLRELKKEAA